MLFLVFTLQTQWPAVRMYLLFIKEPPHKASIGFIQILATQGCIHNLRQKLKYELRLPWNFWRYSHQQFCPVLLQH